MPNLPRIIDLARNDADRRFLEFMAPSAVGRSVVAPPGVSKENVAMLRAAFRSTIHDPGFKKDLSQSRLDLEPLSGKDLQAMVEAGKDVPQEIVARAMEIASSVPKKKKKEEIDQQQSGTRKLPAK